MILLEGKCYLVTGVSIVVISQMNLLIVLAKYAYSLCSQLQKIKFLCISKIA